ncbi:MAG TPA: SDR family NAD(P)-dependent oxidoreductase [Acidimicrobiales bacterium]|nr:SDR family NAD(P)-dependent oxidoreductase [Acidimicrobiales bacterium]
MTEAGGRGIAVQVDHSDVEQVRELVGRVDQEQGGRLDVLVNDIYGGSPVAEWGTPFWEHDLKANLRMRHNAVDTHIITAWHMTPLMARQRRGLIVEVTDGDPTFFHDHLFYDLVKKSAMRPAVAYSEELRPYGVTAVAVSPGWLRSEEVLEHNQVSEDNWPDFYWEGAGSDNPRWLASETPRYTGRGVVALASDPHVARWAGRTVYTRQLAGHYRFTDLNGTRPGHGIYSIDFLDGQPPSPELYRPVPALTTVPSGSGGAPSLIVLRKASSTNSTQGPWHHQLTK